MIDQTLGDSRFFISGRRRRVFLVGVFLLSAGACGIPDRGPHGVWEPEQPRGWEVYAGSPLADRFSPLTQVHTGNADRLEKAWTWEAGQREDDARAWMFQATPIVVGDSLFISTPFNEVVLLDARSGHEVWRYDPGATQWPLPGVTGGWRHRGVAVWSGPQGRRIFVGSRWSLISIDATTGRPDSRFGRDGRVDLRMGLRWEADSLGLNQTSPPAVWEDLVVVGSSIADGELGGRAPHGTVQAFHAETGERRWTWSPLPPAGKEGSDSWASTDESSGGRTNVWGAMTVDHERGLLFVPVSSAGNDFFGGKRPGDNLFSESLVALDLRTGQKLWHSQLVHHDLWDYDLSEGPVLAMLPASPDATAPSVPAVVMVTKMGFIFAFDRRSGEPLWDITEMPVPASDVPGEVASPTQPVPVDVPVLGAQGFSEDNLIDLTPEVRRAAQELIVGRRTGPIFTPPSLEGTVSLPGWWGGANWGAASLDPRSGVLFVKTTNAASLLRLEEDYSGGGFRIAEDIIRDSAMVTLRRPWWWFGQERGERRIPLNQPPWGALTAVDLHSRRVLWSTPAGWNRSYDRHPDLREWGASRLGTPGAPGAIVTAGGVALITGGGTDLLVIDARTGRVVAAHDLGGIGYSVPATYAASDGMQYVVTGVGRDRLVAFRLR
jgi:quinoprotein glucose dehydrogenase